jgi:hypothetical protein
MPLKCDFEMQFKKNIYIYRVENRELGVGVGVGVLKSY